MLIIKIANKLKDKFLYQQCITLFLLLILTFSTQNSPEQLKPILIVLLAKMFENVCVEVIPNQNKFQNVQICISYPTIQDDPMNMKGQIKNQNTVKNKTLNHNSQVLNIFQLPSIKQTQISLNLKNLSSLQALINQNNHDSFKRLEPKDKMNSQSQKQDLLNQNIFIGSNPGLFYSKNSDFSIQQQELQQNREQIQQKLQQQQIQALNLLQKEQTIQQRQANQQRQNNYIINSKYIKQDGDQIKNMNNLSNACSQKSGYTIIDQQSVHQPSKVIQKVKNQSALLKTRINNRHSKHCINNNQPQKQKQFIVPVIINKHRNNKSKYKNKEYSPINDKHLTNFFVTKSKTKYVDRFYQNNKITHQPNFQQIGLQSNGIQLSKCLLPNTTDRKFNKLPRKDFNNRMSTCSNPNVKNQYFSDQFNLRNQISSKNRTDQDKYGQNIKGYNTSTKFIIKETPSQKTKRFFNHSLSTFLNHNYRPLTSRTYSRKVQSNNASAKQKSIFQKQLFIQNNAFSATKFGQLNQDCNKLAMINSFKKVNQNSKKSKKIKVNENFASQNKEIDIHALQEDNENLCKDLNYQSKLKFAFNQSRRGLNINQASFNNSQDDNALLSRSNINCQLNSKQNIKPLKDQFQMTKLNRLFENQQKQQYKKVHLKRITRLQKQVLQKMDIAEKMGVKMPYAKQNASNYYTKLKIMLR